MRELNSSILKQKALRFKIQVFLHNEYTFNTNDSKLSGKKMSSPLANAKIQKTKVEDSFKFFVYFVYVSFY